MKRKNLYSNISENKKFYSNTITLGDNTMFKEDNLYYLEGVASEDSCTSLDNVQKFRDLKVNEESTLLSIITSLEAQGINPIVNEEYENLPLDTTWLEIINIDSFDYDLFTNVVIIEGICLNNSLETLSM